MPYIPKKDREKYREICNQLVKILSSVPETKVDGEINYIISYLLTKIYPVSYYSCNRAIGALTCATLEYYRTRLAPYEDRKIIENSSLDEE